MIDAMQGMPGPTTGQQRAIVAVLRAGVVGPIGQHAKNGVLRGFHPYPRAYYTRRQLAHSRPVLGPSRPLIDTRRHCARRQSGPIGENPLLMTLCPPNIIPSDILPSDNIPPDIFYSEKNAYFWGIFTRMCDPPLPKKFGPCFSRGRFGCFSVK